MSLRSKKAVSTRALRQKRSDVARVFTAVTEDGRERCDEPSAGSAGRFDGWLPESFGLGADEIHLIDSTLPGEVLNGMRTARVSVRTSAHPQLESLRELAAEAQLGVSVGHDCLPIAESGARAPVGRYPLTAVAHMAVVAATAAGLERVTARTPPIRGEIPAPTVAAMHLASADDVFPRGEVQAVAAMAVGDRHRRRGQTAGPRRKRLRGAGQVSVIRGGGHGPVRRSDRGSGGP